MNSTYRKTVLVGGTVVLIAGLGGTALAATGSDAAPAKNAGKKHYSLLQKAQHAQITTGGKRKSVTHTLWRGTVTAVSSSSLTVKALDGASQAYKLDAKTTYAERVKGKKPAASTLTKIAKGDRVFVTGTGTPTVAKRVLELPKR